MDSPWWNLTPEACASLLETDLQKGLSHIKRQEPNRLPERKPFSLFKLFFSQFANWIVWLLILATIISGLLGEWIDFFVIGAIILLNAILGFFQEYKAHRSIASLKKLTRPHCKVMRKGVLQTLDAEALVPGDLVYLEAGDIVPADGRLYHCFGLSTQEATLTGESLPIHKSEAPLPAEALSIGDRKNMAFMGTEVLTGKAYLIVTETGSKTQLGKIAQLLAQHKDTPTPLQLRLEQLGRRLLFLCIGIVAIVFLLGWARGIPLFEIMLISISLAVAAVPEGLPAVITIALAIGARKMAKQKALVRSLASVETLGSTSVICTDKTGTLTKNEMHVQELWVNPGDRKRLFEIGALCNNASLTAGDPTEIALLTLAEQEGINKQELEKQFPLVGEVPFDSERKRMSVVRAHFLFTKGAPEILLNLCTHMLVNGKIEPLNTEKILQANHALASKAYRVLAFAYREIAPGEPLDHHLEERLIFVGLVAMSDPLRPEVKQAIHTCTLAGITPIMITGDHPDTALAIAQQLGLGGEVISGRQLDKMDDTELKRSLAHTRVYARIAAEHKLRIVKALQQQGQVVAVTGDGVNDAPAIKAADIGIAMGIKGSDVTKEAADMIITDDNFASIVHAVEEGRGIYDNIMKFVNYLLSSNLAELLVIFLAMLWGFKDQLGHVFVPLEPVQLLYVNFLTDGPPALALVMDPIDPRAMTRPPRKPSDSFLSMRALLQFFVTSGLIAAGTLFACLYGLKTSPDLARTLTLTTLVILEMIKVLMVRARYKIGFFSNPYVLYTIGGALLLQVAVLYTPPLQEIFSVVPLGLHDWGLVLGISAIVWGLGTLVGKCFKN